MRTSVRRRGTPRGLHRQEFTDSGLRGIAQGRFPLPLGGAVAAAIAVFALVYVVFDRDPAPAKAP